MKKIKLQSGLVLIELLIAMGLMVVFLPALVSGVVASKSGKAQQVQRLTAVEMLKEGEEATIAVRNEDWEKVAINGTYFPQIITEGSPPTKKWALTSGPETLDGFTRTITISSVYRNAGAIDPAGSLLDPSIKKVDITVFWNTPLPSNVHSTLYLSRYVNNNFFVDTTVNDFDDLGSIFTSTEAESPSGVNTSVDGRVVLSQAGGADWCSPTLTIQSLDLPRNGVADAISAWAGAGSGQPNLAAVATGFNASGVSFAEINITNPPSPQNPSASVLNTFNRYKTNGIWGDDNFAYLATDNSSREVVVVDLHQTDGSGNYLEVGSYNAAAKNGSAKSVFKYGNYGFATITDNTGNFLETFDTATRNQVDQISLPSIGKKVIVINNKAYVALEGTPQLAVFNVDSSGQLTSSTTVSVGGGVGKDLYVKSDGSRVYLITAQSGQSELFTINTSNNQIMANYNTDGLLDPRSITVVERDNVAIIVGSGTEPYQVITIGSDESLTKCGALPNTILGADVNAVAAIRETDEDVYAYILVATDPEFRIIRGGPGGVGGYAENGTYESATFGYPNTSTPESIAWNRLDLTYTKPADTDIRVQMAVADAIGGSCAAATFNFVGPAASATDYFTTSISGSPVTINFAIPIETNPGGYQNPGKCFRYRGYLSTTDSTLTPIINEVRINYSP